jgi:hypothetical protein
MPRTRSTDPGARRPRVPLGMFLASRPAGSRLSAWHGLNPADVAVLVRTYTQRWDLVVDIDAHPTITAAAWYLHRTPATLDGGGQVRLLPAPPDQPQTPQPARNLDGGDAALVLVALPRPGVPTGDRPSLVQALCRWRNLLHPGGYLITVPTASAGGRVSHRAAIIAAAHEAGLRWQQHLLIVAATPGHEPRTDPTPAAIPARLVGGRHVAAYRTPLVFTTIEPEAVDA